MNALARTLAQKVETLEKRMLQEPQVEIPLMHRFAPGVYMRQVFMPAGTVVLGHCHKTEHFNMVLTGRATVMIDGQIEDIVAPAVFKSGAGVRKALYIHEDMVWITIHPTNETDLEKLKDELVDKSSAFIDYEQEMKQLTEAMQKVIEPQKEPS